MREPGKNGFSGSGGRACLREYTYEILLFWDSFVEKVEKVK